MYFSGPPVQYCVEIFWVLSLLYYFVDLEAKIYPHLSFHYNTTSVRLDCLPQICNRTVPLTNLI